MKFKHLEGIFRAKFEEILEKLQIKCLKKLWNNVENETHDLKS